MNEYKLSKQIYTANVFIGKVGIGRPRKSDAGQIGETLKKGQLYPSRTERTQTQSAVVELANYSNSRRSESREGSPRFAWLKRSRENKVAETSRRKFGRAVDIAQNDLEGVSMAARYPPEVVGDYAFLN
ncbi:hypothetical protein EVAR_79841_1 [Eumeta japonica]|uniref:Uncharacterized protein n=1 Tax=Eumeta variegata TaxID=151549 RepID=A0A4C1TYV0_EUMVA|nr:hypothetical protein EVAR_79841_1 [Eumeta japonica]